MSLNLTPEQHAEILELDALCQLKTSPGWKQILDELDQLDKESIEDMRNCMSSDPMVSHSFRLRSKAICDTTLYIRSLVENAIKRRNQIIEDAKIATEIAAEEQFL